MEEILAFLFRKSSMKPQIGFAGADKKGLLWLPGKGGFKSSTPKIMKTAPIKGCSQVAYEDWFKPMNKQKCEICWVGLDIDQDDNTHIDLLKWGLEFATRQPVSYIRSSCSGKGVHVIWILDKPIRCRHEESGRLVKGIALEKKRLVESEGIHVCQANKRMFWFLGSKNKELYKSEHLWDIDISNINKSRSPDRKENKEKELPLTNGVKKFAKLFKDKGVISSFEQTHKIYVGDAVKALQEAGEKVYTKSPCSGNGQINGYINILGNKISLWSYADGHVIWNYTDLEGLL